MIALDLVDDSNAWPMRAETTRRSTINLIQLIVWLNHLGLMFHEIKRHKESKSLNDISSLPAIGLEYLVQEQEQF